MDKFQVGEIIKYHGKQYRIMVVHGAGTYDVLNLVSLRYFRITGLPA